MEDVPYGRILREGWLIILIAAVFGAGVAYGITKLLPETYAATSTLLLQVDSTEASLFERNQFSVARIKTYPALVDSPEVIEGVREDLGLDADEYTDRDIRRMLSAENTSDTVLLVVRADTPTAKMSADMANSAAANLSALIEATENSDGDDRYEVNLDQVLPAVEPAAPISPQVLAITGMGLILGLALGAIIAVYRTTTNRRLVTIGDVRRASGLPVVGQIPRRARVVVPRALPRAEAAEEAAYADTVENLAALGGPSLSRFVAIPADAESLDEGTLAGLLDAFAATGRRACVIDLRASRTGQMVTRRLEDVLSDGPLPPRGGERSTHIVYAPAEKIALIDLERSVPATMVRLKAQFDIVILVVDPGAAGLIEGAVATGAGVALVVRHNATSATDLVSLATRLRVIGVRPLGVLMTHASVRSIGVIAESWRESDRHDLEVDGRALRAEAIAAASQAHDEDVPQKHGAPERAEAPENSSPEARERDPDGSEEEASDIGASGNDDGSGSDARGATAPGDIHIDTDDDRSSETDTAPKPRKPKPRKSGRARG